MNEAGEKPDIKELYHRYGRVVYRRCQYFLRNESDAEDAMHEVFLRIVERYGEFRGQSSPLTWILSITTNHCLNQLRSKRAPWRERFRRSAVQDGELRQPDGSGTESSELVRVMLARVSPELQAAAIYYFVDEMTQDEAAAAAGCSVPTLRKRLRQFIESSRKHLRKEDADIVFGAAPV